MKWNFYGCWFFQYKFYTYDGLVLLVAAALVGNGLCGLSPQNIDGEVGVEFWKAPPHAGVEWPELLAFVGCCGGGGTGGCCFISV